MFEVTFIFVRIKFFTKENKPVFLELALLFLFLNNLTFNMDRVLAFTTVTGFLATFDWESADTVLNAVVTVCSKTFQEWLRLLLLRIVLVHNHRSHGNTYWRHLLIIYFDITVKVGLLLWQMVTLDVGNRNLFDFGLFINHVNVILTTILVLLTLILMHGNIIILKGEVSLLIRWTFVSVGTQWLHKVHVSLCD